MEVRVLLVASETETNFFWLDPQRGLYWMWGPKGLKELNSQD